MKRVHIHSQEPEAILRVALERFIQMAKTQGYDDGYIHEVIKRSLAINAEELRKLLHPRSNRVRIYTLKP